MTELASVSLGGAALIGVLVVFCAVWLGAWLERSRPAATVLHDTHDTWAVLQSAHTERDRAMTPLPHDLRLRPLRPLPTPAELEQRRSESAKSAAAKRLP